MKNIVKNFFRFGLLGWCMEILFTSLHALQRRDYTLTGSTSIWMFPIYGMGAFLVPVSRTIKKWNTLFRGMAYACLIFIAEFTTGRLLMKFHACPWDYGRSKWNIAHVIRLDYIPVWFGVGLLFEKLGGRAAVQERINVR